MSTAAGRALEVAYGSYALAAFWAAWAPYPLAARAVADGLPLRRLAARIASASLAASGLRPRASGLERIPPGAAVIAVNHASYLDVPALLATLPADAIYLMKSELLRTPLLGPVWRRSGHVFMDRDDPAAIERGMEECRARLRGGARLVVFPEGTFTERPALRPFLPGAFRLAADTGAPVVPVALRGTRRVLPAGRILPRRQGIEVEVLTPIAPLGTDDASVEELRLRCAEAIAARLDEPPLRPIRRGAAR